MGRSPREVDLLLAVGLAAAAVALAALASDESGSTESAAAAWALGALVLLRLRWPVAVLVLSIVTLFASCSTPRRCAMRTSLSTKITKWWAFDSAHRA